MSKDLLRTRLRTPATAAVVAVAIAWSPGLIAQDAPTTGRPPTVDELIALERAESPAISPDGRRVAYAVRTSDWDTDSYETEIFLADRDTGETRQLTNAAKSSRDPAWAPGGASLAFLSDRGGKTQIYVIDARGGEAARLTDLEEGVTRFAWSPDGSTIAFSAMDPLDPSRKARDERYGVFEIVDVDRRMHHLHAIDVSGRVVRRLTSGDLYVGRFSWSPDGSAIAFDHRPDGDASSSGSSDISIVRSSGGAVETLVAQDGPDSDPVWSPDGRRIAFESAMESPQFYYRNRRIAVVSAAGGPVESLTDAFDENPRLLAWSPNGLFFDAAERTWQSLYRLDPMTHAIERAPTAEGLNATSFSFSRDYRQVAYMGSDARSYPEIFVASTETMAATRLTDLGAQLDGWLEHETEVISWTSSDGATIEGVLHRPADFQAGRRYPLLVVIHGGPTGTSRPARPAASGVYPIDLWLARGAVVLQPNYRGSAGYGEAFRSLNVRNLGIGDAWDVVSGIEHLVSRGIADPARVGAMGWSQGGYISAFLTTAESARFKAVSVGAGISDWMTYYVNTDIHPFTRQYLDATPWDDPAIYAKTSPITYITRARTPTLIQHGEQDRRVPLPNAYELYQGLRDQGVPVKLVVFEGFGHGLNKPKALRAAMEQNLDWFGTHLWDSGSEATADPAGARD